MNRTVCDLTMKAVKVDDGLLFEGGCKFSGTGTDKAYVIAAMFDWLEISDAAMPIVVYEAMRLRQDSCRVISQVRVGQGDRHDQW